MLSKSKHGLRVPLPCLLILLLLVASFSSHAGLPTVNIPGGGGGGDMMQTIKLLFSGFLVLMGLIICAVGFYMFPALFWRHSQKYAPVKQNGVNLLRLSLSV